MTKERERLATESESREESKAERRRARFKVIGSLKVGWPT